MLFDTHCHLQFKAYDDDRDDVIARCKEKNVILNIVGTQLDTSKAAIALAEANENMYASVGVHPIQRYIVPVEEEDTSFTSRGEVFDEKVYSDLIASSDKVVAVGETGLDKYHIPKDKTGEEIFNAQKETFMAHYRVAKKHNLPLVIHVRDAHEDMRRILDELPKPIRGTVHCFSGTKEDAEYYVNAGLHLGFTGIITFPPKKTNPAPQESLIEAVKNTPLDRILVETDAPFLAPQAHRGKRAEPWMVEECVKKVAELRHMSVDEVRELTTANARKLFNV